MKKKLVRLSTSTQDNRERQQKRERLQTKGLISRTIAVQARYKSLYIALPPFAKPPREMTKFCVFLGNGNGLLLKLCFGSKILKKYF